MTHNFTATETTYWIAHGPALHFGQLRAEEHMSSGQAELETFSSYLKFLDRYMELGGDPANAILGEF